MRRLRLVFLALAVLLLAPLALLLARTLGGVAQEREDRHELVALRVFDEAQRALGEFLREEQLRPPDQYRAQAAGAVASPLAAAPVREFVIGYAEIAPDGSLSTPRAEQRDALAARLRDAVPALLQAGSIGGSAAANGSVQEQRRASAPAEPSPGTTRMLQKIAPITGKQESVPAPLAKSSALADESERPADALSSTKVLERLNLATRERELEEKSAREQHAEPAPSVAVESLALEADSAALSQDRRRGAVAPASPPAPAAAPARADAAPEASVPLLPASAIGSPMIGLRLPDDVLILHRTVLRPDATQVEQCVLIDLARLTSWLEGSVLGASGLRTYLDLTFEGLGPAPGYALRPGLLPADRFVYDHRFEQPFDALRAQLSVAPLPDEGGSSSVYLLAVLLGLASTLGLWAAYRRVAAAVHFSERRSNFAAAVSHELKTPLTAIRMYAEMLRDGMVRDDDTRRAYLETITAESERLSRLINNVLEFSRLERRAQSLALVSESPAALVRAALRTLEPHARAQGFVLVAQLDDAAPAVQLDRDAIAQILFNLVDNALKYARGAECKEIRVRCSAVPEGVCLQVRDFGPGVAAAAQPHLFEAFYRAGDELTRQTQGTGIGLALVRELVQQMGGRVSASNAPDGGLAVDVVLRRP